MAVRPGARQCFSGEATPKESQELEVIFRRYSPWLVKVVSIPEWDVGSPGSIHSWAQHGDPFLVLETLLPHLEHHHSKLLFLEPISVLPKLLYWLILRPPNTLLQVHLLPRLQLTSWTGVLIIANSSLPPEHMGFHFPTGHPHSDFPLNQKHKLKKPASEDSLLAKGTTMATVTNQ